VNGIELTRLQDGGVKLDIWNVEQHKRIETILSPTAAEIFVERMMQVMAGARQKWTTTAFTAEGGAK